MFGLAAYGQNLVDEILSPMSKNNKRSIPRLHSTQSGITSRTFSPPKARLMDRWYLEPGSFFSSNNFYENTRRFTRIINVAHGFIIRDADPDRLLNLTMNLWRI